MRGMGRIERGRQKKKVKIKHHKNIKDIKVAGSKSGR